MMMKNRVMSDCYADLQYDEFNDTKLVSELNCLSTKVVFKKDDSFSKRFLETATVIEKNLPLFQSFCDHVDIVTTVIDYLNFYGTKFTINKLDKFEEEEEVMRVISTLFDIWMQNNVQLFLSKCLLQNSNLEGFEEKIYEQILCQYNEVIILEDADVHAVINGIKSFVFNNIWIQEPIVSKFLPFLNNFSHIIHVFRSKKDILDAVASNMLSVISIWSEDIIAAKNLAASLNRDVIFINAFMDIHGGIVLLPHTKRWDERPTLLQNESTSAKKPNRSGHLSYNLFYDGMWQKPVKGTYWLNEDQLWANATNEDIKKCIGSAEKGAKSWSAKSIDSRKHVLSKLASTLECNNKSQLANIISKWTKSLHFYENSIMCPQSGRLEVTVMRKPRGIVALKSNNLDLLFQQLTLALITGNSVIVLCNSVYCSLASYCDMFSTSGIPPGVVNMLSIENVENVLQEYYITETEKHSEGEKENLYIKFTKPKLIVLPVK